MEFCEKIAQIVTEPVFGGVYFKMRARKENERKRNLNLETVTMDSDLSSS